MVTTPEAISAAFEASWNAHDLAALRNLFTHPEIMPSRSSATNTGSNAMTIFRTAVSIALAAAAMCATAAHAGHSDLQVPPADTFMLGGDQDAAMMVSGRNTGLTPVAILSRTGDKDVTIATVAPGGSFEHRYAVGEMALIRNLSATATSTLSVDFTGSAATLSMRYALPQK